MKYKNSVVRRVRTFLVGDSLNALDSLRRIFSSSEAFSVVGSSDGTAAMVDQIRIHHPDLVCVCHPLTFQETTEVIRRISQDCHCPIVVIGLVGVSEMFALLSAGAQDVLATPAEMQRLESASQLLFLGKLHNACQQYAASKGRSPPRDAAGAVDPASARQDDSVRSPELIAIGASTGGPQILQQILNELPVRSLPPVVCVQHITDGFLEGMLSWLSKTCKLRISLAEYGQTPQPGNVYFAPTRLNLSLNSRRMFSLAPCESTTSQYCPNIDIFFESVAQHYGRAALGVLLSGMGKDGTAGLVAMKRAGATTFAQAPESCVVSSMPDSAIEAGAVSRVYPPEALARNILRWAM